MTSQGNGQPEPHSIRMSEHVKAGLKELYLQARDAGREKRFLAALRQIVDRLQREPLQFGEPLYRLPALRLFVRQGVADFLLVDYAVHEEQPLVFIRGFRSLK